MPAGLVRAGRIARNAALDLRLGMLLGGNHLSRGSEYANSDYRALDLIFADRIRADDVLVDVGCGQGRVLAWWARNQPGRPAIGIERDEGVAAATRRRMRRHPSIRVLTGDASTLVPQEGTLFFLFHPFFDPAELAAFAERVGDGAAPARRILYYNCADVGVFSTPDWDVVVTEVGGGASAPFEDLAIIRRADGPG